METCNYCQKKCKSPRSLRAHECRCPQNPNRAIIQIDYSKRNTSNAFLKAKEEEREIPSHPCKNKKMPQYSSPHSESFKEKQRQNAIKRKLGGVRPSLWIQYNGKTLGSTYELEVVKDLDANGIKWNTCSRFYYIDPYGKERTYTPDIYLTDHNVYLDPKNDFLINNINPRLGFSDKEKIKLTCEQNNIIVHILNSGQLSWSCIKKLL